MVKPGTTKTKPKAQEETPMIDEKKTQELLGQVSGKAVETMTVWADANQHVLRELVEFGAASAKESVRLYAELQQSAIEVLKDSQAALLRWQSAWQRGNPWAAENSFAAPPLDLSSVRRPPNPSRVRSGKWLPAGPRRDRHPWPFCL